MKKILVLMGLFRSTLMTFLILAVLAIGISCLFYLSYHKRVKDKKMLLLISAVPFVMLLIFYLVFTLLLRI